MINANVATAILPGGYWADGACHREAAVRPLAPQEEALFLEAAEGALPAQRTTSLLAESVISLGAISPVPVDVIRGLTVGDREALTLHLRRVTLGDGMPCVLTCPDSKCSSKMDLELKVSDLLVPPYPERRFRQEVVISDPERDKAYRVSFRLPTGKDQEEIAAIARQDLSSAAQMLLRHSVESVVDGDGKNYEDIPRAVAERLPTRMAELDPQAELTLNMNCPTCGRSFSIIFDAADFFFQEMKGRVNNLYKEVHLLALHYHWSEAEIVNMPTRKRQLYLKLLATDLRREQDT